jgi:hypothetical protein
MENLEKQNHLVKVEIADPYLDQPGIPKPDEVPEVVPRPTRRRVPERKPEPSPREPNKPVKVPERVE